MEPSNYLEVSLVVDGELAEAVSDVLARYAPGGVVVESTAVTANPDDSEGHAVGPLRVYAYLPVNDQLEETRRKLEESLWYLGRIRPLPAAEFKVVKDTDWSEAWKQHYHPIAIGQKLMIVPAWLESPEPQRIAIRIDPGMAFGTGTHPTTQLCLELAETWTVPGEAAIDVGCGSGILSVAALKLGAAHALAVDIDPEATRAAEENARTNAVSDQMEVGLGSAAEILAGKFSLRQASLVFANILAPVLVDLFEGGLASLVAPEGALLLSGIIDTQADDVLAAAQKQGMALVERRQVGDWVALCVQRRTPPSS